MESSFNEKYLRKLGGSKSMSALVTTLAEVFEADCEDNFKRENVQAKSVYRKYSVDVPLFLHDQPKPFVKHCKRRCGKVAAESFVQASDGFIVNGHDVNTEIPDCSCPDSIQTGWPCKHLLAVFQYFPSYSWEFLPIEYQSLPVFNLDSGEATPWNEKDSDPRVQSFQSSSVQGVRAEMRELLAELNSAAYPIDNEEFLECKCAADRYCQNRQTAGALCLPSCSTSYKEETSYCCCTRCGDRYPQYRPGRRRR